MSQARRSAVDEHLAAMLAADGDLYRRVMDTPVFAYHMNQLVLLALADGYKDAAFCENLVPGEGGGT